MLAQKKPNGKLRLLIDLRKINNLLLDDYINKNHPVGTLTDDALIWQRKSSFVNWIVRKHIVANRWLTNDQLKSWPSMSLADRLLTDVWHKASGHCPHFRAL